jgi:adenylate cyclase
MSDTFALPYEALKKERARLETLHSYNLLEPGDKDEEFDKIVQVASYVCGTPVSLMSLVDVDKQYFKARVGFSPTETSREVSFCSHAIQKDGIMEIPDARMDERFKNNKLVTEAPHIRFYAGSPLVSKNGDKLGTLCVIDNTPRKLSAEQLQHLETLSNQISSLIELTSQEKK